MSSKMLEDLSYWIGIVQTDGCLNAYLEKGRKRKKYKISMVVGPKSLPMLQKFVSLSQRLFLRRTKIWKLSNRASYNSHIGVGNLLDTFNELEIDFTNPTKPPIWMNGYAEYFGPYLAGVIDGDGNVKIRRPKYPQLVIRISSGKRQNNLLEFIKLNLNCGGSISKHSGDSVLDGRKIHGESYVLEFLVSSKNIELFKESVKPHITIPHKKSKIEEFFRIKGVVG